MQTIAIASGKGGVGKSTVTTQLACILAHNGYKVGIIDADIYGPCQNSLLENSSKYQQIEISDDNKIIPCYNEKHKLYYLAVNNLIPDLDDSPMLWRAPMVTRLISEFLQKVKWPQLDFLLLDLPPGTGDIHITIAQLAKLDGAIIVTTPQKMACNIAGKAIQMFNKVNINILGIIENMSSYICTNCNTENHIFNHNNINYVKNLADKYNTNILGAIPIDHKLINLNDIGDSVISLDKNNLTRNNYFNITENLLKNLFNNSNNLNNQNNIKYKLINNKNLEIINLNNQTKKLSSYNLRLNCQCALCKEETTGRNLINKNLISKNIEIASVKQVGNYGIRINFSDGHGTGIYTLNKLNSL